VLSYLGKFAPRYERTASAPRHNRAVCNSVKAHAIAGGGEMEDNRISASLSTGRHRTLALRMIPPLFEFQKQREGRTVIHGVGRLCVAVGLAAKAKRLRAESSRQKAMPGSRPAASAPATPAAAPREVPMPAGIALSVMKRYQALFMIVAHSEVRSRGDQGTLSTKQQETVILDSYKNHIRLWYRDDSDLVGTPNFPRCPDALKRVGNEDAVVDCMLSTTQTGKNAFTGASMLRKAKDLKTDFLKLIADWNMLCGNSRLGTRVGKPPTGVFPADIYKRLVATHFRKEETLRVLQLRLSCAGLEFPQQAHCTADKIREARFSVHYASRGLSKTQEQDDMRIFAAGSTARLQRWAIRGQMTRLVEADEHHEAANPPVSSGARAPPAASSRQSFVEQDQPEHYDIELGFAFKVFGPYEGASHMSPFWTSAWSQYRASSGQHAGRAVADHRQNSQSALESAGVDRVFPGAVQLPLPQGMGAQPDTLSQSQSQGRNSQNATREQGRQEFIQTLANINQSAVYANILERYRLEESNRQLQIRNLTLVLEHRQHLTPQQTENLQTELLQLVAQRPLPPPQIEFSLPAARPREEPSAGDVLPLVRRARPSEPTASRDLTGGSLQPEDDDSLTAVMEGLLQQYCVRDCGAAGDCCFHVLRFLEKHEVPHATLAEKGVDNDNDSVNETRQRIVDHLSQSMFMNDANQQESTILMYGISVALEMLPTVDRYMESMRQQGTMGGVIEIAVWADLMNVRVTIHSTAMWGGRLHVEVVGQVRNSQDEENPMYHIFHIVGGGGRDGHFQLLQPIAGSGDQGNPAVVAD
jgi:hypothetical protein